MSDIDQPQAGFARADEGVAEAERFTRQGDSDAALHVLRRVVQQFPDSGEAWGRAVTWLLHDRRLEEAEQWAADGLAHCPGEFRLVHDNARIAEARGDWEAAAARWQAFARQFPDVWYGDVNAAISLRILGRLDEAEACLLDAQQRLPSDAEPFLEYPRPAEARRDWQEALRRWDAARERFPDRWQAYAGAAACHRELKNFDAAEQLLLEGQARNPSERPLFITCAQLAETRRDWEAALQRWNDVIARFPDEWIGYAGAANALRELQRDTEIEAVLAAGQVECPNQPALVAAYARQAEARSDWETALARWHHVRERFPDHTAAYTRAVACLTELRRIDEAEALLSEAADRFPGEFHFAAERARLAVHRGDANAAARLWEQARERFPQERDAWIFETYALADAGRNAEALARIEAALARFPRVFEVRVAAASLKTRLHQLDQALADWQGIRGDFPAHPIGFVRGADALHDAGRGEEAEALLADALQRFPNDPEVNRAHALIAARGDDLAGAAQRLQAATERDPGDLALAWQWVEAVRQLHRPAEARAAILTVMQRFPADPKVTQQAVRVLWQAGEQDEAISIWQSAIENPAFPQEQTYELACALLNEAPRAHHARTLLRHLFLEPDSGARYWRPSLVAALRLDPAAATAPVALELLQTLPPDDFTPAVRDILRAMFQLDLSDSDIRGFFDTYLARDRLGIAGCLFNDIDRPTDTSTRIRGLFAAYAAERLREPAWISDAAAAEIVALLQFAACASHAAYRGLLDAARRRLNVAELAARSELQTAQGILGSILAAADSGTAAAPAPRPSPAPTPAPSPIPRALRWAVQGLRRPAPAVAVAATPRKLRVALCISGQLRGYRQAFRSWDALELNRHDTTIFVDTWSSVGFNWERIWGFLRGEPLLHHALYTGGLGFVSARYPRLAAALEQAIAASGTVTAVRLKDFYGTPHVRLEDDSSIAFARRSNQWKMYYKMSCAARAARDSGQSFDVMIRARPDREIVEVSGFDLQQILATSAADNVMFMLDHPNVIREGRFWLGDQFAFGTPSIISTYCNTMSDIEAMAEAGRPPRDIDLTLPMHVTPFLMTFYRGILVRPIPGVEFGNFVNPLLLSVDEIRNLLRQDLQSREADDFDTRFLRACEHAP